MHLVSRFVLCGLIFSILFTARLVSAVGNEVADALSCFQFHRVQEGADARRNFGALET